MEELKLICDKCGTDEGVYPTTDPYIEDLYGEIVDTDLCESCYQLFCDEI